MDYKKKSLNKLSQIESYEEIDTRLASGWYVDTVDNKKIDSMAGQFLDTHGANGSTAVTYKLQMYVAEPGWTSRVNRSQSTASDRDYGRGASSITVMEIAA